MGDFEETLSDKGWAVMPWLYKQSTNGTTLIYVVYARMRPEPVLTCLAVAQRNKTIESKQCVENDDWEPPSKAIRWLYGKLRDEASELIRTGEKHYWFATETQMFSVNETAHSVEGVGGRDDEEQLILEANSKFAEKKTKSGYDIEGAKAKKIPFAMCSRVYAKIDTEGQKHIVTPIDFDEGIFVQPKLDGVRCMTYLDRSGNIRLVSRGNKSYDHLLQFFGDDLRQIFGVDPKIILDGELYVHGYSLQKISGACRSIKESPLQDELCYNVFCCANEGTAFDRYKRVRRLFRGLELEKVNVVDVRDVNDEEDIDKALRYYLKRGYEGVMIYVGSAPYEGTSANHRSKFLLKYKPFLDMEMKISAIEAERDEASEKSAIFVCKFRTQSGEKQLIRIRPALKLEERRQAYKRPDKYVGRYITVKFLEYSDDGVPIHPAMVGFREAE